MSEHFQHVPVEDDPEIAELQAMASDQEIEEGAEDDLLASGECSKGPDHVVETTYEGDDGWAGECRLCGAEFWDDNPSAAVPTAPEGGPADG